MHLLAVSGLHVFLVGMVLYMLLRPLLMRLRLGWKAVETGRAALTIVVLGFYMMLTGARPSVVRAVIMSSLFIGGILFQRSSYPLNTLGVAALVLLAVRPPALFDVGFQLSMAAVAALLSVHPRIMEWVPESWVHSDGREWIVSTVSASTAATVGTAPVLLLHFGWVSGAGLLLNLVGIPFTGLGLSAAVSMLVAGGMWSIAGAAFGSMADMFVQGLLLTSREGMEWLGWMGVRMGEPNLWILGALVAGTVALAQWPRPRHRWRCVICGLFLLVGGIWAGVLGSGAEPTLDVVFFDVGQGDAILVTTPDDHRMLVDAGPRSSPERAAVSYSILPFLEQRGIDSLHTVVVTHPDEDHLGGLPEILEDVAVGEVLHSGQEVETELYQRTRRLFRRENVLHRSVQRGEVFSVGSSVRVQVLGPPADPARRGIESENGRSVVLHLAYGETDVLLSGDVERRAERDLVCTYEGQLESRIVKVPHHGSETSSTPRFVDEVVNDSGRTEAVVSVGQSNQFDMPNPTVLRRWDSEGARVWVTSQSGAVWLQTNGEDVWELDWNH
jgi:competence protein ComEC